MKLIIGKIKAFGYRYFILLVLMCFLTPLAAVLTSDAMGRLTEHVSENGIGGGRPDYCRHVRTLYY